MFPKPVYWYSGQFLEPQHFQEADRWHAAERAALLALAVPFGWGVSRLEFDKARLAQGVVAVTRAELFFPDGSRAVCDPDPGQGNAVIAPYDFSGWADRKTPLTLYAALGRFQPRYNVAGPLPREENADTVEVEDAMPGEGREWEQPSLGARYVARIHANPVPDRFAMPHPSLMDSGAQVGTLFFRVCLATAPELEALGDVVYLPIARLICQGDTVELDGEFAPPISRNAADEGYGKALGSLLEKISALGERLRNRSAAGGEQGWNAHLMRRSLARALSDIACLLDWETSRPWDVYRVLRGTLAELHCDLGKVVAPVEYRHQKPRRWLAEMTLAYDELMGGFLSALALALTPRWERDLLVFSLPDAALAGDLRPCIEVRSDEAMTQVLQEGRLVAGEADEVRKAVRLALPVLSLQSRETPGGLPVDGGTHYLAIKNESPAWERVLATRRFGIAYYPEPAKVPDALTGDVRLLFLRDR